MPIVILRDQTAEWEIELPRVSHDEFVAFCQQNDKVRVERTADGRLQFMPSDAFTDLINLQIAVLIHAWNEQQSPRGYVFGPSAGFTLPSGAIRSPDVSWMSAARWNALAPDDRPFPHACPELVVEVMSPSDSLVATQAKLLEYLAGGAQLGLIFDLEHKDLWLYRPTTEPVVLRSPTTISLAPELSGCELSLERIFV